MAWYHRGYSYSHCAGIPYDLRVYTSILSYQYSYMYIPIVVSYLQCLACSLELEELLEELSLA